ncbi:mitochondrial carrier domain-containing protein [Leucosporidium creatinivorum]|uniref:Mitochondrial carrier domain-containing protein n=1 Tax=Leucosporidium creatinivorum TaxID=106004 RepID=A0A1Y2F4Q3_9BASI|nr:mitochondrial carrier domain-containing protein [Leucosporidium creatinivorum]
MSGDLELEARPATVYVDPFTLVASSASAISARLCTHPLDTIRIRIQTHPGALVPPLKQLIPKPRLQNLYAGLPVAIGFSVPALSVYLTSYEASKRYFGERFLPKDNKPTLVQQLPVFVMAGMTAEFLSGAIWTPMDVMKARLQKGNEGTSATKLLKKIWREEGYKGVWRGYWLSNLVFVPYISLYWSLYESFKTHFIPGYDAYGPPPVSPSPSPTAPWTLPITARYTLCSVTACSLAACVTNPIELVQSRWQTSGGKGEGVGGIVKALWRQGGVRAFGRGLGIRVAYAIPANGISMTVYESLKRWKGI